MGHTNYKLTDEQKKNWMSLLKKLLKKLKVNYTVAFGIV